MQTTPNAAHTAPHRRTLWWPWILMPLATLALFIALWMLRHAPGSGANNPAAVATDLSQP